MVFFSCDKCGESVKKQQVCALLLSLINYDQICEQVDKHRTRCGWNTVFHCLDCQKGFAGDEYKAHIKCISEAQKYGGAGFVPKEAKGELKQNQWAEQVNNAIESCQVS